MSLAIYAAPFDSDTYSSNNNNYIGKKRLSQNSSNNKTQKRYPTQEQTPPNQQRVMSVLQSIQNLPPSSEDDLADFSHHPDAFRPPPPPTSAGAMKTEESVKEHFVPSSLQSPNYSDIENANESSSSSSSQNNKEDFYRKYIPNYNEIYRQSGYTMEPESLSSVNVGKKTSFPNSYQITGNASGENKDILIEKLNYMIHLLEEQQDERTNNVTEEVILYSFLGIFIIFIVDSFARVGKYTR
jgi:hypothetical protein